MTRYLYKTNEELKDNVITTSLPKCDAYIGWLGANRNETDFWDDCTSNPWPAKTKDDKKLYPTDAEWLKHQTELCSTWYNKPWVGQAKICDGTPEKNEYGQWVCQPKTECEPPP